MDAPRIAVINHEHSFLALMQEFLSDEGYEAMCWHADEGYEAMCWHADEDTFAKLKAAQPALGIIDIVVPRRDAAWALLERIHNDPTTAHIPVIVCTADVSYVREKAAPLLAYGYAVVEKPFMVDDLLTEMRQLLVPSKQPA